MVVPREQLYLQKLADYIKRNISKGYTLDSLRWALVKQGKNRTEIERAVTLAQQQMAANAPKFQPTARVIIEKEEPKSVKKGIFAKFIDWFKG